MHSARRRRRQRTPLSPASSQRRRTNSTPRVCPSRSDTPPAPSPPARLEFHPDTARHRPRFPCSSPASSPPNWLYKGILQRLLQHLFVSDSPSIRRLSLELLGHTGGALHIFVVVLWLPPISETHLASLIICLVRPSTCSCSQSSLSFVSSTHSPWLSTSTFALSHNPP